MATYEIPLSTQAQQFAITLAAVSYRCTLQWREGAGWVLDMADQSGAAVVNGIPLVTGVDLLAQYPHLGFGGGLWVATDGDADAVPTFDNLGASARLYFVTP